jgi:head-tail adaptor
MIRAGKLRQLLKFKVKSETKNDFGETIEVLNTSFTSKAEVLESRSSNSIVSDGTELQKTTSFGLRFNSKIVETLFIEYKNDIYEIQTVENVNGLDRELIIDAIKYV